MSIQLSDIESAIKIKRAVENARGKPWMAVVFTLNHQGVHAERVASSFPREGFCDALAALAAGFGAEIAEALAKKNMLPDDPLPPARGFRPSDLEEVEMSEIPEILDENKDRS